MNQLQACQRFYCSNQMPKQSPQGHQGAPKDNPSPNPYRATEPSTETHIETPGTIPRNPKPFIAELCTPNPSPLNPTHHTFLDPDLHPTMDEYTFLSLLL